tara:strand:+ start:29859 stop:30719 length:861 start_codon:yes stop_codon:yes gene_type:complete
MSYELSLLPSYLDTVILQKTDYYKNNTNLLELFDDFIDMLKLNIDYEKGKSSGDFIKDISGIYEKLNNNKFIIDGYEIDIQNKNYYIEKYQSLASNFKNVIEKILGNKNIYFKKLSDDVGTLLDTNTIFDDSICPFFDIFYNESKNIPTNIPNTVFNKVSLQNKKLQKNFSLLNDAVLKNNLKDIANYTETTITKTSHGSNLVTDYDYYERLLSFSEEIRQSIFIDLTADLGEYIYFLKNLNIRNQSNNEAILLQFKSTLEGVEENLDILKNQIVSKAYKDNTILN